MVDSPLAGASGKIGIASRHVSARVARFRGHASLFALPTGVTMKRVFATAFSISFAMIAGVALLGSGAPMPRSTRRRPRR